MIGVVICTHRNLARALVETAEMIVGEFSAIETVSVEPEDGMETILTALREAIAGVEQGDGVVLLCDMLGGTPSNLSLSFLSDKVEVITGVNLPMLLKLYSVREGPLAQVAAEVSEGAKEGIRVAGALLRGSGA
ncbi:PTS sugar transporter subunit IIA [Myxococcota bacterium]|nr:PTS sugar transporter subunit IIA [Myxococcota bacterium]MBU1432955.1 PTS sugar transporter subunit IIA [Myxococcota bacterium]MBU1896309.1 PTS sugar transporter subunit IIA [Myxococcota bacterium]